MKRIKEFEQQLTDKVSMMLGEEVEISDFNQTLLISSGEIRYEYACIPWGCTMRAFYKGVHCLGNGKIKIDLSLRFEY